LSASVIARRVIATPARPASEAWTLIVSLLAPDKTSDAYKELLSIAGIASSLISDEAFKGVPAVMRGNGPRVRLYCLYDEDAVSGEDANEAALATVPTQGDWKLSLPCPADDLTWVRSAIKEKSSRITARDMAEPAQDDDAEAETTEASKAVSINLEAFLRK
jgi:hypothetical protein